MHDGIAMALAWPETMCKQSGSWYDHPMRWIGINKDNYYKVGHCAVVLINMDSGYCSYFDFGRYHAPAGHGRVRSAETDHDLKIETRAEIAEDGTIENYREILSELVVNNSCHGSGTLHAAYCQVSFNRVQQFAEDMQHRSPIAYGPFVPDGTNCSRFVSSAILAGAPSVLYRTLLRYPITGTPTPIGTVRCLSNYSVMNAAELSVGSRQTDSSLTQNYPDGQITLIG